MTGNHTQETEADLLTLEQFVIDNDDLSTLESRIGLFNIFDALRIGRVEIRHSNVLAWLLDPAESHGQGELFLRSILLDILRVAPIHKRPFRALDLDGHDLGSVEVLRERDRIDLSVVCDDPKFTVIIENKVDSDEHSNQLQRYEEAIRRAYPDHRALFIFLSPDGRVPRNEDWVPYSYKQLHTTIERALARSAGAVGSDVGTFIKHYLDTVRNELMDNPDIAAICKKIYSQHRRAIELIWEHRPISGSKGTGPVAEYLNSQQEHWIVTGGRERYVYFYPKFWVGKSINEVGAPLANMPCKVFLECESWSGDVHSQVAARLVVGPGPDQRKRVDVINALKLPPYNMQTARKQASDTWTRMNSKTLARWEVDSEAPDEKIKREFEDWLRSIEPILSNIPKVLTDNA